jgi:hypothetical protein
MIGYHTPETKHEITTPWIFSVRFFPVANHRLYASLVDENSLLRKYLQIMAIALILIFSMSML